MKEFILPKTGKVGVIDILNDSELEDVLELHAATRAALPADKKRFILPQGMAYFQNMLTRMTGVMVGIRTEGKLVAQMVLMGPLTLSEAIGMRVITHNDVPFHHASLSDNVVVYKSLASLPDWRGNDLAMSLVGYANDLPFTQVTDHVFAQVSVGNKRSWDSFMRQGFGVVAAAYDPDDGMPRFVFQKPAFGFDFAPQKSADDVDPAEDFPAIVALTQREGLVGVYENDTGKKFAFLRNREEINLMPTMARVSGGR